LPQGWYCMYSKTEKVMSIEEAVDRFVKDGCHISIGGFTINRNPMAAVYTMIRKRIRGLHLYVHSNGTAVDELIGADCVSKLELAYGGNGRLAPTCIRLRKAIESRKIICEDYTNYQMALRFLAGAMGVPFLPTRSSLGSDIADVWGFSAHMRACNDMVPDKKLVIMENPFGNWCDTKKIVLVPAICPDVTIIHVQKADSQGTCRILGNTFADVEQAKAARQVIVTCDELVPDGELRKDPDRNQLSLIDVSAVCPVAFGAYPTASYRLYDYDAQYLSEYAKSAEDDDRFRAYHNKFIFGVENHEQFLALIGSQRLASLKADPRKGYSLEGRIRSQGDAT